jgi:hypothetical protein
MRPLGRAQTTMAFAMYWYELDSILIAECAGYLRIDVQAELFDWIAAQLDGAAHKVDLILEWRGADARSFCDGIAASTLGALKHPNMGQVAIVGMTPALHEWIDVFATIYGVKYVACQTVIEAARVLHEPGTPTSAAARDHSDYPRIQGRPLAESKPETGLSA